MAAALLLLLLPSPAEAAEAPSVAAAAPAVSAAEDVEAAIMNDLRRMVQRADPRWALSSQGWQPGNTNHHCSWYKVECDSWGHVFYLVLGPGAINPQLPSTSAVPSTAAGQLPPEVLRLAYLPWLRSLKLQHFGPPLASPIPPEWLQPGAFLRLKRLSLAAHTPPGAPPLPDIPPGVLPYVEEMWLHYDDLRSTLPVSWGATPGVLPTLRQLFLEMHLQGGLPAVLPPGFRRLQNLMIKQPTTPAAPEDGGQPAPLAAAAEVAAAAAAPAEAALPAAVPLRPPTPEPAEPAAAEAEPLPLLWGSNLPELQNLALIGLNVKGPIPGSWLCPGCFPSLTGLMLTESGLSGTLPPLLFSRLPTLKTLSLANNRIEGTLPGAWAFSNATSINLESNRLSGPALPPAWLSGSMPHLQYLSMSDNPGLTGTLPPSMPWPSLYSLALDGSGLAGSVPASWCYADFAESLARIDIRRTALDPELPGCLAITQLGGPTVAILAVGAAGYPGGPVGELRGPQALAVSVTAALTLCMLAVAGVSVRSLLQSRRRQRVQQVAEQRALLPTSGQMHQEGQPWWQPEAGPGSTASSREMSSTLPAPGSTRLVRSTQRGRLAGLLSCQLGGTSQPIGMAPLDGLQEQLGHQMLPAMAGMGGSKGQRELATHLPPHGHTPRDGSSGQQGAGSSMAPASLLWGLPTHSLRVHADAFNFLTDSLGDLVEVGSGAHATVFLAQMQTEGQLVAVKVLELEEGVDSCALWQEVALLQRCRHPRVVPILGVALKGRLLMLTMEFMQRGSLRTVLRDPDTRSELHWRARGRQVVLDVAEALDHLHTQLGVMHSDLKPANVLLSQDWRACLADLGEAQMLGTGAAPAAGLTRLFAAPEQLMGQQCTVSADMYAFGLLLVSLLTGQMAEARGSWRLPRAPEDCPQDVAALVGECLLVEPQQRPSAAEALARLRAAN